MQIRTFSLSDPALRRVGESVADAARHQGRSRPQLLTVAVDQLIGSTFAGFAGWIGEHSITELSESEVNATAVVGLRGLMSSRLLRDVLGAPLDISDEVLVASWVPMMSTILNRAGRSEEQ